MKKASLLLFALCFLFASKAETINLGYCGGECATQGTVSVEGKMWVDGAIFLPVDMLKSYKDGKIIAINVGLATKINVDSVRAWIRTDLDGDNLSECLMTLKSETVFKKGWNTFELPEAYQITADEGIYIGYSYHQKGASGVFSVIGSPMDNGFYARFGADAQWQEIINAGILSVEAVVETDNMPDYDLGITSAYAKLNDEGRYDVTISVINNGKMPISGFTLAIGYDENDLAQFQYDLPLEAAQKIDVKATINADVTAPILVQLIKLNDADDEITINNAVTAKVALVKKVLIEEFTSEKCNNCPPVASELHEIATSETYKNRVVIICHHSGYKADWLTQDCDIEIANRYGVTFNPALMYDRFNFGESNCHSFPSAQSDIINRVEKRMAIEAGASISFAIKYDEDAKTIKATVNVEKQSASTNLPQTLTVCLTEDDVYSINQSGATGNFRHQHVIRGYNNTFGDEITWNGTKFEKEYEFKIDTEEWVLANCNVVAFVTNYDKENIKNSVVDNSEIISLRFLTDNIEEISNEKSVPISKTYYNLNGFEVNDKSSGILIEKCLYSDGSIKTRKTFK